MKYRMIDRCRDAFPVAMMCRLLKVSPSGYYDWQDRPLSGRAAANEALFEQIENLHSSSDGVWEFVQKLTSIHRNEGANFGFAVDLINDEL